MIKQYKEDTLKKIRDIKSGLRRIGEHELDETQEAIAMDKTQGNTACNTKLRRHVPIREILDAAIRNSKTGSWITIRRVTGKALSIDDKEKAIEAIRNDSEGEYIAIFSETIPDTPFLFITKEKNITGADVYLSKSHEVIAFDIRLKGLRRFFWQPIPYVAGVVNEGIQIALPKTGTITRLFRKQKKEESK